MSEVAIIKKARASGTSPTGAPCNSCPRVGLPILPVRMAVVSKAAKGVSLPKSASDPCLDAEDQSKLSLGASSYALRTLRPGFLYLYYKEAGGAWTWHCYMVSPSGSLREVPLSSPPTIAPSDPVCKRAEHSVNSSLISIQHPEKVQKAYIAYSEHFWTEATRDQNAKLLGTRMREFSPAAWWKAQSGQHAFKPDCLADSVLEYAESKDFSKALSGDAFEFKPRKGLAGSLQKRMDAIAQGKGMVVVVPDPIGCISAANSLRMHAVNRLKQYIQAPDVAWKHATATQIQGLRDYVLEQAKEQIKAPRRAGRSGAVVRTREQRIQEKAQDGWSRFEEHYSESARTTFLKEYTGKCEDFQKEITALDKDYCAWLTSSSYKLARADYDREDIVVGCQATALDACILAGGVLSEHSLKAWTEMLQRKADDLQNYAVLGILVNQAKWAKGFQSADEKSVGDYVFDTGTLGKFYDFSRNAGESKEFGDAVNGFIKGVNRHAGELLYTVVGAIGAIAADGVRKGLKANDATLLAMDRLQAKLGLAYSHLHVESQTVLIKIELTIDEWHRIATSHMRANLGGMSKQASEAFASMAVAVQLRVPPNSSVASKLVPFMCWLSGTSSEISKLSKLFGEAAVGAGIAATRAGVNGAGKTIVTAAGAGLKGAALSTRAVTIVGHTLKSGSRILAQFPPRIAAASAFQIASKLTRNGLTIAGTTDVRLAGVAVCFQALGLRTALNDYENNVGWKRTEAAWAIGSSIVGLTGATLDIAGKAVSAIKGSEAVVSVLGMSAKAAIIVRVGGYLGAGASIVDCIQSTMKSYTLVKRGDTDAAVRVGAVAAFSAGAAVAGYFVAGGSIALFGPVGWLILCIGAGLVFAYLAFMAEDTPVGIWLDRCSFGKSKRAEGKFANQRLEADALEMIAVQLVIQVEWHDTVSSFDSDEVEITVKRPAGAGDAVVLGLRLHGETGTGDRLSSIYGHGVTSAELKSMKLPSALYTSKDALSAQAAYGGNFEAAGLSAEGENKLVVEDSGAKIYHWETRIEVNTRKFQRGTVHVRYFPDKANPHLFSDQELRVAD
jgi:hypothetical protein